MLKRARLYVAISLLIQSISFMLFVLIFLFRNKRNTAGAFCTMGLAGGIVGTILLVKQFKEEFKDKDILAAIDDLCDNKKEPVYVEIPVDETADESEFH